MLTDDEVPDLADLSYMSEERRNMFYERLSTEIEGLHDAVMARYLGLTFKSWFLAASLLIYHQVFFFYTHNEPALARGPPVVSSAKTRAA